MYYIAPLNASAVHNMDILHSDSMDKCNWTYVCVNEWKEAGMDFEGTDNGRT